MAVPRPVLFLGKVVLAAALLAPPTAIWLSGRFGRGSGPDRRTGAPAPPATVVRSEDAAVPVSRLPAPADVPPAPSPPVTVGVGAVTVPPPVPGAAAVAAPRAGQLLGEPKGLPDPNRSEATPR